MFLVSRALSFWVFSPALTSLEIFGLKLCSILFIKPINVQNNSDAVLSAGLGTCKLLQHNYRLVECGIIVLCEIFYQTLLDKLII